MTRNDQFEIIRRELVIGLHRLQAEGKGIDDIGAELVQAGVIMSVLTLGPAETIQGLRAQLKQLERVYAGDGFPTVKGHA